MSIVGLIVVLLILGVALFFLKAYIDARILTIIVVLLALTAACWLLAVTGLWPEGAHVLKGV